MRRVRFVLAVLGASLALAGPASAMNVQEFIALRSKLTSKTVLVTGLVACMAADERICYVFDDSDTKSLIMFDTSRLPPEHLNIATRCAGECTLNVIGVVGNNERSMTRLMATSIVRPNERNK